MYNVLLVLLATLGLTSCTIQGQGRFYPDRVRTVPPGFVALNPAIEELGEGVLSYLFWETNIAFIDSENVTFFQTGVRNSEFIVMHGGEYYVNEEKFLELAEFATIISDQLNRVYSVGDTLEFREIWTSLENPYRFHITAVYSDVIDEVTKYTIEFLTSPNVPQEHILDFFLNVKTVNGNIYDNFIFTDENTVYIELNNDEKIDMLVLKTPARLTTFVRQNSIRRIRVNH